MVTSSIGQMDTAAVVTLVCAAVGFFLLLFEMLPGRKRRPSEDALLLFQVVETLQTWGALLLIVAALDIGISLPSSALALACYLGSNILLPLCPPPVAKSIVEHRYHVYGWGGAGVALPSTLLRSSALELDAEDRILRKDVVLVLISLASFTVAASTLNRLVLPRSQLRLEKMLRHYPRKFELSRDAFWFAPCLLVATLVNRRVGSLASLVASAVFWISNLLLANEVNLHGYDYLARHLACSLGTAGCFYSAFLQAFCATHVENLQRNEGIFHGLSCLIVYIHTLVAFVCALSAQVEFLRSLPQVRAMHPVDVGRPARYASVLSSMLLVTSWYALRRANVKTLLGFSVAATLGFASSAVLRSIAPGAFQSSQWAGLWVTMGLTLLSLVSTCSNTYAILYFSEPESFGRFIAVSNTVVGSLGIILPLFEKVEADLWRPIQEKLSAWTAIALSGDEVVFRLNAAVQASILPSTEAIETGQRKANRVRQISIALALTFASTFNRWFVLPIRNSLRILFRLSLTAADRCGVREQYDDIRYVCWEASDSIRRYLSAANTSCRLRLHRLRIRIESMQRIVVQELESETDWRMKRLPVRHLPGVADSIYWLERNGFKSEDRAIAATLSMALSGYSMPPFLCTALALLLALVTPSAAKAHIILSLVVTGIVFYRRQPTDVLHIVSGLYNGITGTLLLLEMSAVQLRQQRTRTSLERVLAALAAAVLFTVGLLFNKAEQTISTALAVPMLAIAAAFQTEQEENWGTWLYSRLIPVAMLSALISNHSMVLDKNGGSAGDVLEAVSFGLNAIMASTIAYVETGEVVRTYL